MKLLLIVGFADVLQHTPRAVTVNPPVAVTLPPLVAVEEVMAVAAVVVRTGATAGVVNVSCPP